MLSPRPARFAAHCDAQLCLHALPEGETEPFKKVSQRCCTDVFCLVIFLAYLIAVVVIGVVALGQGDIKCVRGVRWHRILPPTYPTRL